MGRVGIPDPILSVIVRKDRQFHEWVANFLLGSLFDYSDFPESIGGSSLETQLYLLIKTMRQQYSEALRIPTWERVEFLLAEVKLNSKANDNGASF